MGTQLNEALNEWRELRELLVRDRLEHDGTAAAPAGRQDSVEARSGRGRVFDRDADRLWHLCVVRVSRANWRGMEARDLSRQPPVPSHLLPAG